MTCRTIIFGIYGQVNVITLYFGGQRDWGRGVRENNGYCFLLRMAHLIFLFSGDLKMVLIFRVKKVFQKGTMFKLVNV